MEAIFHLLGIAAGQRWHGGPRAEAGAETTTGGVFFCSSVLTLVYLLVHV